MPIELSIVTICLNAEKHLEKTIQSIIPFLADTVEYFIIDGGSKDGTVDIIKKYSNFITKWISEKDNGIYDAMNKGISMCNGTWIALLNAGDIFIHNPLNLITSINNKSSDIFYGDGAIQFKNGQIKNIKSLKNICKSSFYKFPLFHPSVIVNKTLYQKYGIFKTSFKIAGDYELLLRFTINGAAFKYVPITLVIMDGMGISNSNWKLAITEMKNILQSYGLYKNFLRIRFMFQTMKSIIYHLLLGSNFYCKYFFNKKNH
jgi:glycosyltransferase involved in cell wall biosynthesis